MFFLIRFQNSLRCLATLLILTNGVLAQTVHTDMPIKKVAYTADLSRVAFVDENAIRIVRTSDMSVIGSVPYDPIKKGTVRTFEFDQRDPNLLWFSFDRSGISESRMPFWEYPGDSVFAFDYADQQLRFSMPGNWMLAFRANSDLFVGVQNNFFAYMAQQGIERYSAKPGSAILYPDKQVFALPSVVRAVAMDPASDRVILIYYKDLIDGQFQYELETRDLKTFEVIRHNGPFPLVSEYPVFSSDGRFLMFQRSEHDSDEVQFFSVDELAPIDRAGLTDFPGTIDNGTSLEMKGGALVASNLQDDRTSWTVWANLTELFSIAGGLLIDQEHILVYGTTDRISKNYLYASGAIQKLNLKDISAYTKVENSVSTEYLFDPKVLTVSDNRSQATTLKIGKKGKFLYASKEGLLEIWSTSSRMKLYEIKLGSGARFFPNDNDSSVLILEEYSLGMGYNDFRLSSLDLNTGLYRSRIVRKDIDKIEFTVNNACRCLPIKSRPGEWLCNDNSASLWRIKEAELSVQLVKDFDPGNWGYLPDGLSMLDVPGSDRILLQMGHSEIKDKISGESRFILDSLILMNRSTLDHERVTVSKGRIVPVSKDIHVELGENRITFNSWVGENKFKEVPLGEWRIDRSEVNEEKLVLFCTDEKTGGRRVYRFDRTPPFLCDTIEVSSINGYLTCFGTQLLSVYDGQISSLAKELGYWATWNTKNKFIGSDDLFQPGNGGEILIGHNKLIDLGTLNEVVSNGEFEPDDKKIPLPNSLQAALLKGTFEGKILYVEINRYVGSGKKPYARFVIAERFNYQKIIWASEPFILGKDEFFFPSKVMVSNSGRYVAIFSDLQSTEVRGIFIIDLESKGIREFPMKTYGNVVFGWDDRYALVSGSQGNTSDKWVDWMIALPSFERTPESKLNRSVLLDTAALKVEFSSQFVLVSKYVQGNFIKQKELYAREYLNCVLYSKSDNKVYAGSKSGTLFCWDPAISTPQKKINVGSAGLISLIEKEGHLYALLESGVLVIYDRTELKEQVRIAAIKKDDLDFELAWFTPEGYYKAGKAELSNYHFVRQGEAFPLLSYDVFLNRPEKILEKLGYADFDLIEAYSKVYAKRLQRYGLKDNDQFLLDELPVVSILNKASLVSDVPDANVKLNIEFRSAHKLSALLVKVNGVPLGDMNGIPLHNKTSGALSVEVPLGSGKNMITVSAKGMNGVEGMPDQLTVFGRKTNTARVVYAGIGVSQYVDSSMNLRFADDDVQRMAAYLKSTFRDRSDTLLLVNEQVTKKNILAMRDRLMKTSIDDIVILSFSGHGLLDSLGNFYFANHEIDFDDPKNTGISFDEIQLLLTGIPARRKLLLLDACHSGEVDKSQLMVSTGASEVPLGGKGASAEAITSGFFADNSFELMLNNFGDFSNNNGAFVISAAGGEEVAYETEQVGGVFTHAVLRSIADLSGNERFTVNALQKLVNRYVEEFSEGRQKPTTRNQNVSWDWDFEL